VKPLGKPGPQCTKFFGTEMRRTSPDEKWLVSRQRAIAAYWRSETPQAAGCGRTAKGRAS